MLIFFRCYCHILIKIKVHWSPLDESLSWSFIFSKNAPPSKNILSSSSPSPLPPPPSCKHKFLFTLVIFSSTSSSNNERNGGKGPTLERGFEFTNGIHVKIHRNQLWLEAKNKHGHHWLNYDDNMHANFFKLLLDFYSIPKFSTLT